MKKIIYSLFVCITILVSACSESSQDTSTITYFIDFELLGDTEILWPKGTAYVDPGYVAILDGEDVTDEVVVINGSVNVNTPGVYTLRYTAVNQEGFGNTSTRRIYVYDTDPSPIESGFYTTSSESNRDGTIAYGREMTTIIIQINPSRYFVSDLLGGWYDQRAGYGYDYRMQGYINLDSNNTLTAESVGIPAFGYPLSAFDGSYDPIEKKFTWSLEFAEMIFNLFISK